MILARAFLAVLVLLPVWASAETTQTQGSHVRVSSCYPHRHTAAQAHAWIDPYGYWHGNPASFPWWDAFVSITYANGAQIVANEVDFGVVSRGSLVAVAKDVGTFSPGIVISHEFVMSREVLPIDGPVYCSVLRVKYADGSVWLNPSPPQP